jgi:hypothetical protein
MSRAAGLRVNVLRERSRHLKSTDQPRNHWGPHAAEYANCVQRQSLSQGQACLVSLAIFRQSRTLRAAPQIVAFCSPTHSLFEMEILASNLATKLENNIRSQTNDFYHVESYKRYREPFESYHHNFTNTIKRTICLSYLLCQVSHVRSRRSSEHLRQKISHYPHGIS